MSMMAAENPFGFGQLLNTLYLYIQKPTEITMLNTNDREIYDALTKKFIPESILVTISKEDYLDELKHFHYFLGKEFDKNKTTVYVCKDFACSLPLNSISEIEKLL
jgi:uncharacterized protein YyaL (SSP411 family)